MTWEAWTTIAAIGIAFGFLALSRVRAELVLLAALTVLMTAGVVEPKDALAGLANEGLVAIGLLFIVAAGLRDTGAVNMVLEPMLGRPRTSRGAAIRLTTPVAVLSSALNNTPIVAVVLPVVTDWAKKLRMPPSKLLIPLSYAAILGGVVTLIGTSTNLIVNGMIVASGRPSMGLFDIAWVGVPCAAIGLLYMWTLGDRLLPAREPAMAALDDPREYSVEMMVEAGSGLVGQTIEEAGLRALPNVYLMEIDRDGELLVAVSGRERLRAGDRLVFVGVVDSVVELQRIRGLKLATDQVFKLDSPRAARCLVEAVVSTACPIVGNTIRDGKFRSQYNAAVIAVARDGERVRKKIGDIVLQPGDTLLLEAHPSFLDQQRNSRDFFLVSQVANSSPPTHERAGIALAILVAMMVAVATGALPLVTAAVLAAGSMLALRCTSLLSAQRSVDFQVLILIAAALGLGSAMQSTGAAAGIARSLLEVAGDEPLLALAAVYGITMLFTETMSNAAAAVLMFPIGQTAAAELGVDAMPFFVAIMIAASCSFLTPIGYQTNLMVYGPGGYRFGDYARVGAPLTVLLWVVSLAVIPRVWAF